MVRKLVARLVNKSLVYLAKDFKMYNLDDRDLSDSFSPRGGTIILNFRYQGVSINL